MDERSFDNLVRDFTVSVWSRRTLALAALALGVSAVAPLDGGTDAARRRHARRKKSGKVGKGKRGNSGKGSGDGKKPQGGDSGDCGSADSCPRDPETGKPGFVCPDGLCSCGGACCEKGYACFVENSTPSREVCCFIDGDQSDLPDEAKLVSCPGPLFNAETCCDRRLCNEDGTCSGLTLGRYRRNPR